MSKASKTNDSFQLDPQLASLEQAKEWLRPRLVRGAQCPCCRQRAQVYARPITSTMAISLMLFYRAVEAGLVEEWVHIPSFLASQKLPARLAGSIRSGDFAKLRFFGLVEEMTGSRDDKSDRVGRYRLTELGKSFCRGEQGVPAHVFLYDGKPIDSRKLERLVRIAGVNPRVIERKRKQVFIRETLGKRFSYEELMRAFQESV